MPNRQALGKMGEDIAVNYLEKEGYRILMRNYRCAFGEIDIVAQEKSDLVFIEVKTRRNVNYGLPFESVTKVKQQRIRKIALHYLQEMRPGIFDLRFDVVSILAEGEKTFEIELIKNAF
ncbi:MAG: YraN family protein [Bacillota bacterium]